MPDNAIAYNVQPLSIADLTDYTTAVAKSFDSLSASVSWVDNHPDPAQGVQWVHSRQSMWAAGREYSFAIRTADLSGFLGVCSLNRIDWQHACGNLNFWTLASSQKKGVATTGAHAVVEFAFQQLKLARVEVLTAHNNRAAQKVARNIGAKREGLLKDRILHKNERQDAVLYAAIASRI
ncbi:MAG: GNAT family N-acetyltransferase [Litoreibacter sp.]